MKEIIRFNTTKKLLGFLIVYLPIGIGIIILLTLLHIDIDTVSIIFALLLVIVVFYLNRNEPDYVTLDMDIITITFANRVFFKKKSLTIERDQLIFELQDTIILVKSKQTNGLLANIRKSALSNNDWNLILNILI